MAEAWNNLGVLRARDNDLEGAQSALEKAVEINPQHGPAQENLGDIYVAMAQGAYSLGDQTGTGGTEPHRGDAAEGAPQAGQRRNANGGGCVRADHTLRWDGG